MSQPSAAKFRTIERLIVSASAPQKVLLTCAQATLEASVLAQDLFRLRIAPGRILSERPSWAVSKTDWPPVRGDINVSQRSVTLSTTMAQWRLDLERGSWKLSTLNEHTFFSVPARGTGFCGLEARLDLELIEGEGLFGLGETTGTFNKRGLIREFWNIDVLGYSKCIHPGLRSLYISIPFAISIRNGQAAGLFWDNPARQIWDLGQTKDDRWQLTAALGEIDLYLFAGPEVERVVERYTELTGRMPLPPKWGLGNQQCRYSYETRRRVEQVARTFRRKRIPCDVIYFDIHHMEGYRVFTFGKAFPKPAQLMERLARWGFKAVTIVDPGVKDDSDFDVLKRGTAMWAFVKSPGRKHKKDYIGKVWPGESRFPDFLNEQVRRWWGTEQARLQELGIAGFWNDMNEPANFGFPTKTLPEDCLHESDAGPMSHAEAHNLYGMQMARASRDGALRQAPTERPFVITRAGYAGVQRYALIWTGDNSSCWEHLADSIQMLVNLSLSGVAFCGADVGGFVDNCTGELLVRWTQLAVFTPFLRNHSNIGTVNQEPWSFGPRVEGICKRYLEWRYRLLPYLYCLFAEAHQQGTPIMRPLFWHHQDDANALAAGDQFLLGRNILVAPILRQGAPARSVYLPTGDWYDFWTGQKYAGRQHMLALAGLETIPLFIRAGAIVPMGPVQQYVGEKRSDMIELHVWPGLSNELRWYEDDGRSMEYERGLSSERLVEQVGHDRGGSLRFGAARGLFTSEVKKWRIILHEIDSVHWVSANDTGIQTEYDSADRTVIFDVPNLIEPVRIDWWRA